MNISRRRVIQVGAAGAISAALAGPAHSATRTPRPRLSGRNGGAMNVVFMVADGMSYGTLTLADMCHRQLTGHPSTWISLFNEHGVRRSSAFTNSADSHVTDSAAGATAWSIGERVKNGRISYTPDDRTPTPLWVHARQQGKAVGLVTTTTITHATPSAFIANVPDRAMEGEIAIQMMNRGFEVALGGGRGFFPDSTLQLRPEVRVVTDAASLRSEANGSRPVLGLFAKGQVPYVQDRSDSVPSLEEMARFALSRLLKSPNGFVLMVEGGRVDHAAHANDAGALVHEMMEFDRTIKAVHELTANRNDTLVIITSDHGNANPALTKSTSKTRNAIDLLTGATRSFESIFAESLGTVKSDDGRPLVDQRSPEAAAKRLERLAELVKTNLHIDLKREEKETLAIAMSGKPVDPFGERQSFSSVLGSVLANHNLVSFLSSNHTSDMVEVTSWGPGSESIRPMIDNNDLHKVMVDAMDLAPAKAI